MWQSETQTHLKPSNNLTLAAFNKRLLTLLMLQAEDGCAAKPEGNESPTHHRDELFISLIIKNCET